MDALQIFGLVVSSFLGLGFVLFITGRLEIKFGSELYAWNPALWPGVKVHENGWIEPIGLADHFPPWFVVAFLRGYNVDAMRKEYFVMGYQKAMEGRCPHCGERLTSDG